MALVNAGERDALSRHQPRNGCEQCGLDHYLLSTSEMAELECQLKQMFDSGHIQPSVSPYAAPVLFVHARWMDQ